MDQPHWRPDDLLLHPGLLGPRSRGPAHGSVRVRALQRDRVPRQTVRPLRLRGEDPRGDQVETAPPTGQALQKL